MTARAIFGCAGGALVFHVIQHSIVLRAVIGDIHTDAALRSDAGMRELTSRMIHAAKVQVGLDLAFLVVLGLVAWRRRELRLGVLAAFIALVCVTPGIGGLDFVLWNVPFWLAVAAGVTHLAKQPPARNVLLQLAAVGALSLLLGHFVVTW